MNKMLALGMVFLFVVSACTQASQPAPSVPTMKNVEKSDDKNIEINSQGFSPAERKIKMGETVVFVNKDSKAHWPASNNHPTHKMYPGSDIALCGTDSERGVFDACNGLGQGEMFRFTFKEKGTWGYHDHMSPGLKGSVIVE